MEKIMLVIQVSVVFILIILYSYIMWKICVYKFVVHIKL